MMLKKLKQKSFSDFLGESFIEQVYQVYTLELQNYFWRKLEFCIHFGPFRSFLKLINTLRKSTAMFDLNLWIIKEIQVIS